MQLSSLKKIVKIIGLLFLLLMVMLASILVGKTASQYFAKAAGCPATNIKAVQVGTNNAVITWETKDNSQGRVQYGTDPQNLSISAESSSGKTHNVPLTLLTPNSTYYFLVAIGNTICDSAGQGCDKDHLENCTPWTFTTNAIKLQEAPVAPIEATPTNNPVSLVSPNPTASVTGPVPTNASGTSLSPFCQQVKSNLGGNSSDAAKWPDIKQYDIDNNGRINGVDIIKCISSGK